MKKTRRLFMVCEDVTQKNVVTIFHGKLTIFLTISVKEKILKLKVKN